MEYDYVITLKRPDYKYINIVSQLLLLIFIIAFSRYALAIGWQKKILIQSLLPISIIGLWVYTFIRSKEPNFVTYYRLELFMAALGWLLIPVSWNWIAWLYAVLGLTERWVKFPDEIGFTKEKIVRNSLPKKIYEWVEIENVIIRDGLFTMDLRNNKIIQKELDEPVSKEMENEFNEYCKEMLHF